MEDRIIKSCPCCGGNPILIDRHKETAVKSSLYWVECKSCGLSTQTTESEEEAISLWNRRVGESNENREKIPSWGKKPITPGWLYWKYSCSCT